MRKKLQGFTLVELLAAMAIIAILIGLAGFGISIALRNSRDTERKNVLNSMQVTINDYYTRKSAYPTSAAKSGTDIILKENTLTVGDAVPTKGHTVPFNPADGKSTTGGTIYRYGTTSTGYLLCVKLENGDWFDLSNGGTTCSTTGAVVV